MEQQEKGLDLSLLNEELRRAIAAHTKPMVCFEGLEVTAIREGYVEAKAPVTENSLNPYGNAHGGWLFALCDTCSGLAASTWGRPNVTLQASVNYIRGAKPGDTVTVKATSRHSGGRTAMNQVELFDGQGRLLLTSSFTMYYMDGKK